MALVHHNTTLEYATNTVEFRLFDDLNEPMAFDTGTTFNIERIDDPLAVYTASAAATGTTENSSGDPIANIITFSVTPPITLQRGTDSMYDYHTSEYNHIYSVKSNSNVYISGKINLVKVAG